MNGTKQHAIPIQALSLGQMRYIVSYKQMCLELSPLSINSNLNEI